MAYDKALIRKVSNHSIIFKNDESKYHHNSNLVGEMPKKDMMYGAIHPHVRVNEYQFSQDEINFFEIDTTGFLPSVKVGLTPKGREFFAKNRPKDGDIAFIFIRSLRKEFETIKMEFIISNTIEIPFSDGRKQLIISGKMHLENLYVKKCVSYEGTSYDTLLKISDELKLGFSSNVTQTDDKMRWLCGFHTMEQFIKHITLHAWNGEDTFYTCFIDYYYQLNFVEVNRQLTHVKEFDEGISIIQNVIFDYGEYAGKENETEKLDKLILTNLTQAKDSNIYGIIKKVVNDSTDISYKKGYKRTVYSYDVALEKIDETSKLFIEPLTTQGTEGEKILLRGNIDSDINKRLGKHVWAGVQYSAPLGNTYPRFAYAKEHNLQNLQELEKMKLVIDVPLLNTNYARYRRLPILIFEEGVMNDSVPFMSPTEKKLHDKAEIYKQANTNSIDRFHSGFYIIQGIKLSYNLPLPRIKQELVVTRREWNVPNSEDII